MTVRHAIGYAALCLATIALAISFIAWTRSGSPLPTLPAPDFDVFPVWMW